jgi:hypothetical protein
VIVLAAARAAGRIAGARANVTFPKYTLSDFAAAFAHLRGC